MTSTDMWSASLEGPPSRGPPWLSAKSGGTGFDMCISHLPPSTPSNPGNLVPRPGRSHSRWPGSWIVFRLWVFALGFCFLAPACAVFVNFDNCLSTNIRESKSPMLLQFVPLHVWATFDRTNSTHDLNVTVYGNVSGIATNQPYPAPDDPQWSNPNDTVGKIVDLSPSNDKYTTFFSRFNVLSYTPYNAPATRFCEHVLNTECPIAPIFNANSSDISDLAGFTIAHDLTSSYSFTTITATLTVTSGDANKQTLACVSASITPRLGSTLQSILRYLPLMVLILVGVATITAAVFCPWGTSDVFRWTSNYGRDPDTLRLVTPGFADCLQYLQFIVLTGSLSLNYPGYYQPVVSRISWSTLMFNQSFASNDNGTQSLRDGIYTFNGTYGLDRMSQLVGMTATKDVWPGMIIWLLVILAAVIALVQLGFAGRWLYRQMFHVREEDLRAKNAPFTLGNVVRVMLNFFLLPIVALSMFQLIIASKSPKYAVALAVVLLLILIFTAAWLMLILANTKPRSHLFDDLPTLLTWGPLYNTYSDDAATFAIIPIILNFVRGIAIGAVQPSGIAQLVLLAICEVILALTLNAFRPFASPTSMNSYHTVFAIVRLITLLLSVAFVPTLGVEEGTRGWFGYAILLMHALVLSVGFFLNALQTLIEVIARMAGAGGEGAAGAARGGLVKVLGVRQLSRRTPRREPVLRHSMTSDAAMLGPENDGKSIQLDGGRVRSFSGSSGALLNRPGGSDRQSLGLESTGSQGLGHSRASGSGNFTPTTPAGGSMTLASNRHSAGAASPRGVGPGSIVGIKQVDTAERYYRPPRQRRSTFDEMSPGSQSHGSWASGDWTKRTFSLAQRDRGVDDPMEGPSASGRGTPLPAYLGNYRTEPDAMADMENTSPEKDYAVREVDYYYGVRGPALKSTGGTRKLKTGPADPTGPVSSATGFLKNLFGGSASLFGGKTKETGKGFEVVRSARAPPPGLMPPPDEPDEPQEPYHDEPEEVVQVEEPGHEADITDLPQSDRDAITDEGATEPESEGDYSSDDRGRRVSQYPPSLPAIDTGGGIELPSRIGSRASKASKVSKRSLGKPPSIPRKSSRRQSSLEPPGPFRDDPPRLSAIAASPPASPRAPQRLYDPDDESQRHLQPSVPPAGRLPFSTGASPTLSNRLSAGGESTSSSVEKTLEEEKPNQSQTQHARHSSSALGTLAPDIRNDRPSSMGYVQQHRASDNIHEASPDSPEINLVGSTAELVEPSRRGASPP